MKSMISAIIFSVSLLVQTSLATYELGDTVQLKHIVLVHTNFEEHVTLSRNEFYDSYTQQVSAVAAEAKQIVDEALSEFNNSTLPH